MQQRQLRYFVRVVELGSIGRAMLDFDLVQSGLNRQINRLKSEMAIWLLQRSVQGGMPT